MTAQLADPPLQHKLHSPPCEAMAQMAELKAQLAAGGVTGNPLNLAMSQGLPGIGEEMQM